eukprot:contig_17122_g4164
MTDASISGARFFVTTIDDKTGWKSALPIIRKSDAAQVLMNVLQEWETRQGRMVKAIRSDNGKEFLSDDFKTWLRAKGIQHQLTTPYTPQQNGVAERYNRTLMEGVVTMLADAGFHKLYWGEAVMAANYVLNRSPQGGASMTLYQAFYGHRPNVSHLRVLGCPAYVMVPHELRRKLVPQSERGIFLGYAENSKAYRVSVNGSLKISRDVIFDETARAPPPVGAATAFPARRMDTDTTPAVMTTDARLASTLAYHEPTAPDMPAASGASPADDAAEATLPASLQQAIAAARVLTGQAPATDAGNTDVVASAGGTTASDNINVAAPPV